MKGFLSLNFLNKRLSAVVCACLIAASAVIGVSASENIAPLDWGFGIYSTGNFTSSSNMPESYQFRNSASDVFSGNVTRLVSSAVGFTLDSGYTYTYTATYHVSPVIPSSTSTYSQAYQIPLVKHQTVGYTYISFSEGVNQSISLLDTTKYLYSISLSNGGETVTVTLVINTDQSGIVPSDVYFYCPFLALYKSPSSYPALTMGNSGLTVIKDLDGSAFDKSVLDAVNAIREDNENYHSNALELLDQILHVGDDKIVPSNEAFDSGVSQIDSAESVLVNASDPSGSAMSDFSAKGKTTVTTVNTSYRQTFAFINSLVTNVMDDLDFGILVFLALTLGLVAYVLGRIK